MGSSLNFANSLCKHTDLRGQIKLDIQKQVHTEKGADLSSLDSLLFILPKGRDELTTTLLAESEFPACARVLVRTCVGEVNRTKRFLRILG